MASLSVHERYGRSQYTFPWKDRAKWLQLLNRFHRFSAYWSIPAFDTIKKEYTTASLKTNSLWTLEDLKKASKGAQFRINPETNVVVTVSGHGFWGTMPFKDQIDWSKLPVEPNKEMPESVTSFARLLVSMSHIMGDHTDLGRSYDFTQWKDNPIDKSWFPYIIQYIRDKNSKLISFYYSPTSELVYLLFQDDEDAMVVRFNSHSGAEAAEPRFDLDDGFLSEVPHDMTQAFHQWTQETGRDPKKPLLTLAAPYNVMTITNKRKRDGEDQKKGNSKKQKVEKKDC